jgi:hypothetical protein
MVIHMHVGADLPAYAKASAGRRSAKREGWQVGIPGPV